MSKSESVLNIVGGLVLDDDGEFRKRDLWIQNGKFVTGESVNFQSTETKFADGKIIAPAYLDLKLNGAYGIDFSDVATVDEDLDVFGQKLYSHGIVAFLPTINATTQAFYRVLLPKLCKGHKGAEVLGAHADGPFLNPYLADGNHAEDCLKSFEGGTFKRSKSGSKFEDLRLSKLSHALVRTETMVEKGDYEDPNSSPIDLSLRATFGADYEEHIRLMSLAPELPRGMDAIRRLREKGIITALSHSNATFEIGLEAVYNGAHLITHIYNAMPNFSHRAPGLVGLMAHDDLPDDLYFGLIADLVHTHPEAIILAARLQGDRIILISDAVMPTGLPGTAFMIRNTLVKRKNGKLIRCNKDSIAIDESEVYGSDTMLDQCVRNFYNETQNDIKNSLSMALRSASQNPARLLGEYPRYGSTMTGGGANFVLLDSDLNVSSTFHEGKEVFCKEGDP